MIRRCAVLLLLAAGALRGATPPDDAGTPRAPEDLAVDLVLREPRVAQPVFLHFDARGRLWVVQYLQYPDPAGLRAVSRDSVWRVIYDERKPPPPYDTPEKARFRGRDRVSIFSDRDGDGSFETEHTFVDGLNITTAAVPGRGGVWVLSPPQLLFYPDADGDDTPDGPPVVKLDGFNLEDTHSVANSLRWGPDGWLYGAVGSTVSTEITRPGLDRTPVARLTGQGIWRYHPESARFEIFAEGGGNTFGVEIDAQGRVFSGHNGGNTRGFHYVQGGYHRKGFDKHGELSNPHAYGFFPAMPHPDVARFTHNFVIYAGGSLPLRYHGKLIGTDPMNNWLPIAELTPRGSTFATRDVDAAIRPGERRFRPVDIKHGPDGALYVADWRDLQVNHYRNHEGQITREDGRIYRLRAAGTPAGYAPFDLTRESSAALLALLDDPNRWRRETARQVLGDRRDASLLAPLRALLAAGTVGQLSLEALWALHVSGGFNAEIALTLLAHPDAHVRGWTVRLLGDEPPPGPALTRGLAELALREPNVEVRGQLAATARRLPTTAALPVLEALFGRDEDADDPYVPLQLWWALESKVSDDREAVTALLATASEHSLWSRPLVRRHLASRLMRRLAAGGSSADLQAAARLLNGAPDDGARRVLLEGFEQAFEGRPMPVLPPTLVEALLRAGGGSPALRVRQGSPEALQEGLARLADAATPAPERARLAQAFGEVPYPPAAAILARLVAEAAPALRPAILAAAAAYPDPAIPEALLRAWETLSAAERPIALSVLASRRASAEALLGAVAAGRLPARDIPRELQDQLRRVDGGVLAPGVDALYGPRSEVSAAEFEREIARVVDAVRAGRGSPYAGRELYARHCLACHRLHAKGGDLGPDLTPYPREDLANLVLNIVHPSAEIREGYEPFVITTKAGATHTGFLARQDAERVVLRDLAGISLAVERGQLAALRGLGRSLMPEGLLTGLSDGELRDLFAYLRTTQPLVGAETAATAAP